MKKITILNGPNLDRLGKREPEIYGRETLPELEQQWIALGKELNLEVICFHSNAEAELIGKIWEASEEGVDGLIINLAAFTHTSVALRDALAGSGLAAIEVHISNVYAREEFRQSSMTAGLCIGVITGLGTFGYEAALRYFAAHQPPGEVGFGAN